MTSNAPQASQPQVIVVAGAGSSPLPSFDKLNGQENWSNWKFLMERYLHYDDLWEITDPSIQGNLTEPMDAAVKQRHRRALTKISMMVDQSCIVHIRDSKTPASAWKRLSAAYEGKGLTRRLRLLRNLFNTRLEQFSDMQSYVSQVLTYSHQLADISAPLEDEFIGVILLNGLTPDFDPLVLALENTNVNISSDLVKGKRLDQASKVDNGGGAKALFSGSSRKNVQCYNCEKFGHIARYCKSQSKQHRNSDQDRQSSGKSKSFKSKSKATSGKSNQKEPLPSMFTLLFQLLIIKVVTGMWTQVPVSAT